MGHLEEIKIDMSTPIECSTEWDTPFGLAYYLSPSVENDEASATFEEPASAHDSVPDENLSEKLQQLGTWPQSHQDTRLIKFIRNGSSTEAPRVPGWGFGYSRPKPLSIGSLARDFGLNSGSSYPNSSLIKPTRDEGNTGALRDPDLDLRQSFQKSASITEPARDYGMELGSSCTGSALIKLARKIAKAMQEASNSKSELKDVAVVRDALGSDSPGFNRPKRSPIRQYLPMILQGKTIGAQHDTGAEGSNLMTNELAEDLNLHLRTKESDRKAFSMGTGKVRRAIGRVKAWCTFAKEPGTRMKCWFYVLPKLASPLIMGSQFLRDTRTMSHFTHRLEDQPSCTPFAPMVNLVSSTQQAKRRLVAFVDDRQTYINADSGSHLDLVSSAYTKKYGYKVDRRRECRKRIQLADATTAETIGQVKMELMLHDGSTYLKTFDVLPGLTSEVLIGEDTLAELKIFTEHESSFIDVLGGERHFELSILSYLGRVNEFLVRKLHRSNRRSQYRYQRELSLGLSPEFRY